MRAACRDCYDQEDRHGEVCIGWNCQRKPIEDRCRQYIEDVEIVSDSAPRDPDSASADSREYMEKSGRARRVKNDAFQRMQRAGSVGLTVKELREGGGWHHGEASGALSTLHSEGFVRLLAQRRNRNRIYVLPEHVGDRELAEPARVKKARRTKALKEHIEYLEEQLKWPGYLARRDEVEADVQALIDMVKEVHRWQ